MPDHVRHDVLSADRKNQKICKPGSVPPVNRDGRSFLWDDCCQPPRATNPDNDAKIILIADRCRSR